MLGWHFTPVAVSNNATGDNLFFVFVLTISSLGGSMVPRFMMPDWLQTVSLFTPNAWAIEGFYGALIRGDSWAQLAQPGGILAAVALVCLLLAALPLFKTPD
ncbi:hypothetical protein HSBAA_18680 [Vreelandella sulfidaeris]|uniref:ABC-2 type transporter transmembrane domain-containing protein n=1 Tax=Vreelandella sulfidaeris TaxID=115553 RepID=A0A455U3C6_9GAMM|nr:hypothetical protein HSBAA_18680 [Halomonas sulfidaeris]